VRWAKLSAGVFLGALAVFDAFSELCEAAEALAAVALLRTAARGLRALEQRISR
jgi:hypothetical protein